MRPRSCSCQDRSRRCAKRPRVYSFIRTFSSSFHRPAPSFSRHRSSSVPISVTAACRFTGTVCPGRHCARAGWFRWARPPRVHRCRRPRRAFRRPGRRDAPSWRKTESAWARPRPPRIPGPASRRRSLPPCRTGRRTQARRRRHSSRHRRSGGFFTPTLDGASRTAADAHDLDLGGPSRNRPRPVRQSDRGPRPRGLAPAAGSRGFHPAVHEPTRTRFAERGRLQNTAVEEHRRRKIRTGFAFILAARRARAARQCSRLTREERTRRCGVTAGVRGIRQAELLQPREPAVRRLVVHGAVREGSIDQHLCQHVRPRESCLIVPPTSERPCRPVTQRRVVKRRIGNIVPWPAGRRTSIGSSGLSRAFCPLRERWLRRGRRARSMLSPPSRR